mgnify:CR=1 FL=1
MKFTPVFKYGILFSLVVLAEVMFLVAEKYRPVNLRKPIPAMPPPPVEKPKPWKYQYILSPLEQLMMDSGCVPLSRFDRGIKVMLKYASSDNFTGINLYKGLTVAYFPEEVAKAIAQAQKYLKADYPYYSLVIYDATRPLHIQKILWDSLKVADSLKSLYVTRPEKISMHNFGAAVDIGIVNADGMAIDMGTEYDFFGEAGYTRNEEMLVKSGKMTYRQKANRELLRSVMKRAGFTPIETEWWHFNYGTRIEAEKRFKLIP